MKTLSNLNATWWYRLLKVLYFGMFFFFVIGMSAAAFDEFSTTESKDIEITCLYGNKDTFKVFGDKHILVTKPTAKLGISESMRQQIIRECEISQNDMDFAMTEAQAKTESFRRDYGCPNAESDVKGFMCGVEFGAEVYKAKDVEVSEDTLGKALGIILLCFLGTSMAFEVIRRIFYYVTLGSLKPKK